MEVNIECENHKIIVKDLKPVIHITMDDINHKFTVGEVKQIIQALKICL